MYDVSCKIHIIKKKKTVCAINTIYNYLRKVNELIRKLRIVKNEGETTLLYLYFHGNKKIKYNYLL